jgi:hypothetical protein
MIFAAMAQGARVDERWVTFSGGRNKKKRTACVAVARRQDLKNFPAKERALCGW